MWGAFVMRVNQRSCSVGTAMLFRQPKTPQFPVACDTMAFPMTHPHQFKAIALQVGIIPTTLSGVQVVTRFNVPV
jgi:hypothetical protein